MGTDLPTYEEGATRTRHPVLRACAAVMIVAVAAGAVLGVRQQVGLMGKHADLRLAFPGIGSIDREQWKCSSGELQGHLTSSCYPPDAPDPTVNYELLPEPQTAEDVVAAFEEVNADLRAQDTSGTTPTATLLGTSDWTPTGEPEPWGTVTRWRFDGAADGPLFQATYRYASEPYGLTVYAESTTRIDELVRSLTLLPPDQLPD